MWCRHRPSLSPVPPAASSPVRVLVLGADASAIARAAREQRRSGARVALFVGEEEEPARQMADEVLGGVDEVVRVGPRERW